MTENENACGHETPSDTGIYYFSGTGNCLAIAKRISGQIENSKIYSIACESRKENPQILCENAVFVFPSYAYEMPKFVSKFIKRAEIKSAYIAAACSYGSVYGAVFRELNKILKRKGKKLDYGMGIKSVENYIPIFGPPKENKIEGLQTGMYELTDKFCESIKIKETNKPKGYVFGMGFIGFMFKTAKLFFPKFYRVKKTCNACGLCARLCPSGAIKMTETKPKFSSKCEHCQGCFNYCPSKSIRFKGYTPKSRRYTHPDVKAGEINQDK